jgi:hypothetical protein
MADNDVYRGDQSNVVYVEQAGQRRWVLDGETLTQTLGGWSKVQVRPQAEVDAIPAGDTWPSVRTGNTIPDGYLIAEYQKPEIDVLVNTRRCWIPDPETFDANGFDWRNVGQISTHQWNGIPVGPALRAHHPIQVASPAFDVGSGLTGGHFMQTVAYVPEGSSTLYCTTRTWCTNWVVGFTGGVVVSFLNDKSEIIGSTGIQAFGVDALLVVLKAHDRTDAWTWPVPTGTTAIKVFHKWAPRDRWNEIMAEMEDFLRKAAEAYERAAQFCRDHPDLCEFSAQSGQ